MKTLIESKNIKDCKFKVFLLCADCDQKLNETVELTANEIYKDWGRITMGAGFNAGNCPNGCRSTFSDLNINTRQKVVDAETGEAVVFKVFKFLRGKFYSDDKVDSCNCIKKGMTYHSDKYPAVCGACGKWAIGYVD